MSSSPRLDLVHRAICAGQIQWKPECLKRFLQDADMKDFTQKRVNSVLRDFVHNQKENCHYREEYSELWLERHPSDPWWYFAVIPLPEFKFGLFVKMKLLWDDGDQPDDAFVEIVSVHEEKK